MRILKVYVRSFGKLANFEKEFDSGVNLVINDNSFGKTTLASFIKAMFYGLRYEKNGGFEKDSKIFQPWNSTEKFGGTLTFEHENKRFRIERYFGLTAKGEEFALYDEQTGQKVDCDKNLGDKVFGLGLDSFEKTFFIPQESVAISANNEVVQKLSGMLDGGSKNDYEKALNIIVEEKKKYRALRGRGGVINSLEEEVVNCEKEVYEANCVSERLKENKNELETVQKQIKSAVERQNALQAEWASVQSQLAEKKSDSVESKEYVEAKRYVLESGHGSSRADHDKATEIYAEIQRKTTAKSKCKIAFVVALSLALLCGVLAFAVPSAVVPFAVVAVLSLVVAGYFFVSGKKQSTSALDRELQSIFARYSLGAESVDKNLQTLNDYANKYQYHFNVFQLLRPETSGANQDLSALQKKQSEVGAELKRLAELLDGLNNRQVSLQSRILVDQDRKSVVELTEKLQKTKQTLAECNRKYERLEKAQALITSAKESLATAYLPMLRQKASEYMSVATNGKFGKLYVDDGFHLSIEEDGQTHGIEWYSRGIKELAVFCFRFALSEMLTDGLPFLLIDDAFVNLDEKNFECAVKLLKKQKKTQIIYFSCHKRSEKLR